MDISRSRRPRRRCLTRCGTSWFSTWSGSSSLWILLLYAHCSPHAKKMPNFCWSYLHWCVLFIWLQFERPLCLQLQVFRVANVLILGIQALSLQSGNETVIGLKCVVLREPLIPDMCSMVFFRHRHLNNCKMHPLFFDFLPQFHSLCVPLDFVHFQYRLFIRLPFRHLIVITFFILTFLLPLFFDWFLFFIWHFYNLLHLIILRSWSAFTAERKTSFFVPSLILILAERDNHHYAPIG